MRGIANALAQALSGLATAAGAAAGDQSPAAAEHGEDREGNGEPDRPEHQQEDREGEDREGDEEEFHACVVLQ